MTPPVGRRSAPPRQPECAPHDGAAPLPSQRVGPADHASVWRVEGPL